MHSPHMSITHKFEQDSVVLIFQKCSRVVKPQLFHQEPVCDEISNYYDGGYVEWSMGRAERAE